MDIGNRLAFSTLGCPEWRFEQVVRGAAEMGFAAVEVRGIGTVMDTAALPFLQPENRAASRALLQECGVRVCGLNTSASFHSAAHRQEAMGEGEAALALCGAFGIPAIRVFGDALVPGEDAATTVNRVAQGLGDLADKAPAGVKVLLEVHGDFNTIETIGPVLHALGGHPAFGLLWDIEHSYRAYGNDVEPFYRLIRPSLCHVHVKDCVIVNGQPVCLPPGDGGIDIPAIVRLLEAGGYQGLYSFEWEKRWQPQLAEPEQAFPQYVSYMRGLES